LDKVIVTAMLIVAGVISAVFVFKSIFPVIAQSSDAMTSMEQQANSRLQTQIQIIHAAQINSDVIIWVKNVGSTTIPAISSCDLFFGPQGDFARIPYGTGTPSWQYTVENSTNWEPTTTVQITISGYSPLTSGTYYAKLVTPNGISDEFYFSW
jgi:archaeal flagellar protein FlaG